MQNHDHRDDEPSWATELRRLPGHEPLPKPPNRAEHWLHANRARGGLAVDYFVDRQTRSLTGIARFGETTAGHTDTVHGGCIATLVDDALGTCAWLAGHYVVSLSLTTDFVRYVPVGAWVRVHASVVGVEGRKVIAECELASMGEGAEATVHARGRGLFLQVPPSLR